jgi:hypothetical protein
MLASNPSADSVASTDRGGSYGIPFQLIVWVESPLRTGTKAINPGGAGQSPRRWAPPEHSLPVTWPARSVFRLPCSDTEQRRCHKLLPPTEAGRPFIMR